MNLGGAKVLFVEKNTKLAELWASFLARRGFDCAVHIYGSSDAGKLLQWGQPDVIVSGIEQLDGRFMSGEEIWTHVYGEKSVRRFIPVIQLTAAYIQAHGGDAPCGPAFSYLQKPVKLSQLLKVVKRARFQTLKVECQSSKSPIMTAELSSHALLGVLQFVGSGFKSGILMAESPQGEATLAFAEGVPMAAFCDILAGEEAVYEVLTWTSGQATFYEGALDTLERNIQAENVGVLIEEAQRQIAVVSKAESLLALPDVQIRLGSVAPGADPLKRLIAATLATEKTLKELLAALPNLTYRQLVVLLSAMETEGQIARTGRPRSSKGLSPEFCAEMLKGFEESDVMFQITHPPRIMVYSPTPSLAMRFIGALCGAELASSVIMRHLNLILNVSDAVKVDTPSLFADTAAVVVLVDPDDSSSGTDLRDFLDLLNASNIESTVLAYLERMGQGVTPPRQSSVSRGIRTTKFEFTREACLGVIASVLKAF